MGVTIQIGILTTMVEGKEGKPTTIASMQRRSLTYEYYIKCLLFFFKIMWT
jgi:hypothetical protein